ncbi:MAG: FMN-binding protein [Coriobacteriales bacterium]|jgi:electron transport complex protein RnfG|nr:FMN-binding protein [Coriobacteriales bacterium]MDO5708815.1 FMN-binding protein [Coriobacteriales bacterium]
MSDVAKKSSSVSAVRPVLVLVAICMVAGALLGAVHEVTAPIAEANAQAKAREIYAELVPDAKEFVEVECAVDGCTAALEARDAAGGVIAYVIVAQSRGYGGQVPIAVAFAPKGTVKAITAMANDETPGLGTKIANESYIGQYVGLPAKTLTASDIDLISGATISSKAALAAFDIAVEAYEEVH